MVQSADTRQWEQQVRIPVVPTADLTKSSTQSGAGFINCTFYDVEDSFGKRTFVNKRPGFVSQGTTGVGLGTTQKFTTSGYWNKSFSPQGISTSGSATNQFGQSYSFGISIADFQSTDIAIVRNGAVELRAFPCGLTVKTPCHESEFRYEVRAAPYLARTWTNYNTRTSFSSLQSFGGSSMYPIGIVAFDVIAIGGGPFTYDFHQWVCVSGGHAVTDANGTTWTAVIGGAVWTSPSAATYAGYTAGSTVVADSLGNQWMYIGRTRTLVPSGAGGTYNGFDFTGCGTYLNGYMFWCDTNGNVRNSILNYPMAYTASGYLSPSSGDKLVTTAKVNSTLLVFSSKKTYFYSIGSSGNSGYQGSPLQPIQQANKDIGCAFSNSVAESEGMVALVAIASNGTRTVVAYNNTNYQELSNDDISVILNGSTVSDAHGWFIRTSKGLLYILQTFNSGGTLLNTLVYSFDNGVWGQWDTTDGVSSIAFRCVGKAKSYYGSGTEYFIGSDGYYYYMQDAPVDVKAGTSYNYTMQIRTPKLDFGTTRYKFMNWISIATEQRTYNTDTGQMNIRVGFEDDNGVVTYLSSTPNPTYDGNWLRWTRCGRFRRRRIIIDNSDQYCPVFSNVDIGYTLGER